jgi:hypothetical protein
MVAKGISNTAFGGPGRPVPAGLARPGSLQARSAAATSEPESCYARTELDVTDSEFPPE